MAMTTSPEGTSGRTAVVTGAASGIGAATCEALARDGTDVVAADVDDEGLERVAERVAERGERCTTVGCDVTDPGDCRELADRALEEHGSIEVLVTAAGIGGPGRGKPFAEVTLEEWHRVLDVNLTGTFLAARALYDHMVERGYGKVVCIGSMSGVTGSERPGPNYAASKGGVHAFARWLATRGAPHGVYANAIAPGPVWTPMTEGKDAYSEEMTPLNRMGEPEDVAQGVVYLASSRSDYVTGTVLDMNGGLFMR